MPVAARIAAATSSGACRSYARRKPSTAPRGTAGKISQVTEPVVRTYLELDDPAGLRPAPPPRLAEVAVARVTPPDGALSRWFYT